MGYSLRWVRAEREVRAFPRLAFTLDVKHGQVNIR
jgi:hypothetical protein